MNKKSKTGSLLWQMAINDMKARYANSVLGIVWIFVLPLITIGIFWFVYELGFRNTPISSVPFILWFSCGYVPWLFFSDFLIAGTNCMVEYSYLVKKIKFQVELLPIVKMAASMMVHLFFAGILFLMFAVYRVKLSIHSFQVFYYSIAMILMTYGCVLILASTNLLLRDIAQIANIMVQIGFWVTPIIWNPHEMGSIVRNIMKCNPMYYIVEGYRDSLVYHVWFWEKPKDTILFWCITIGLILAGKICFHRLRPFFADEL